jgi:hypothetical protein
LESEDGFTKALKSAAWGEWVLDVMAKPREYKGQTKMRINVRNARPVNWATDSVELIQMLASKT